MRDSKQSKNEEKPPVKLKVKSSDQNRLSLHANLVSITTTSNQEVMLDFIFVHPNDKDDKGIPFGNLVSRVILPLNVAKEFRLILDTHMGKGIKE